MCAILKNTIKTTNPYEKRILYTKYFSFSPWHLLLIKHSLHTHTQPVAPTCLSEHDELLGALKHETLTLKCEVDASPPAETFHWTFNSSGEQTDLPSQLHSSEVSAKVHLLTYTHISQFA